MDSTVWNDAGKVIVPRNAGSCHFCLKKTKKQFLLKPLEETQHWPRLILDFWPPELADSKNVSFSVTKFVVICYSDNGKLLLLTWCGGLNSPQKDTSIP